MPSISRKDCRNPPELVGLSLRKKAVKAGKNESETITQEQMCQIVATEVIADGHSIATNNLNPVGVSISYVNSDRSVEGSFTLLVSRKRN